jgi:hypothetical protein
MFAPAGLLASPQQSVLMYPPPQPQPSPQSHQHQQQQPSQHNGPSQFPSVAEDRVDLTFQSNPEQPHEESLPPDLTGLKKFDLNRISTKSKLFFCAKSDSGKSVLFQHILHHISSHIRAVQVMCKSEKYQHFYEKKLNIPASFLYDDLDQDALKRNIDRQTHVYEHGMPPGFNDDDRNLFMVWDDVMTDKSRFKWPVVRELCQMGRHMDTGLALMAQDLISLDKDLRNQFDFIFIFACDAPNIIKNFYENFGAHFRNINTFTTYLQYYTNAFSVLVLDVKRGSTLQEKWYWFRADPRYKDLIPDYPNSTMHEFHRRYHLPSIARNQFSYSDKNYRGPASLPGLGASQAYYVGGSSKSTKKSSIPTRLVRLDTNGRVIDD